MEKALYSRDEASPRAPASLSRRRERRRRRADTPPAQLAGLEAEIDALLKKAGGANYDMACPPRPRSLPRGPRVASRAAAAAGQHQRGCEGGGQRVAEAKVQGLFHAEGQGDGG